jgi:ribosomal protein S27AE
MRYGSFEDDRKYCPRCRGYVKFIVSIYRCYCVNCGAKVELFDPKDRKAFEKRLKREGEKSKF